MEHTYPEKQCSHGMCLNHSPQWRKEENGVLRPVKSKILRLAVFPFVYHCGKPMRRMEAAFKSMCQKCGRTSERAEKGNRALCACCGYMQTGDVFGRMKTEGFGFGTYIVFNFIFFAALFGWMYWLISTLL